MYYTYNNILHIAQSEIIIGNRRENWIKIPFDYVSSSFWPAGSVEHPTRVATFLKRSSICNVC